MQTGLTCRMPPNVCSSSAAQQHRSGIVFHINLLNRCTGCHCSSVSIVQDVTDSVFYDEFGRIMMNAPIVGLDFTRYLPVIIVPYALLQVESCASAV
jgi:hypothetical protein